MSKRFGAIDSWWLDLKLGVRMLIQYPGLTLAGGAGIAVAVALAAGGFSAIYGTMLSPSLPFDEGDRLVSMEIWDSAVLRPEARLLRDYQVWRTELKSVQEVSAFRTLTLNVISAGVRPESVRVAAMSAAGFRVARVSPMMGRYFSDEHERDGAPAVVVIGENIWRNRFAGDSGILGKTIQLGATAHSIIGVMPKGFAFPVNDHIWVPLRTGMATAEPLTGPALKVFGRLTAGATLESAQAELGAYGQRMARELPQSYARLRPLALPYHAPFIGVHENEDVTGLIQMHFMFISLLVLVCLNVAILVYTRTAMRQAELGLRSALGASRGRIVGQLFIEALVLSTVAALAGLGIAALALRQIGIAILPIAASLPFWLSFELSPVAVVYALGLSVLAAAIVGVLPALKATQRNLQFGFRVAGTQGMRLGKTCTVLIVAQVSFAVALLPPAVSSAWSDTMDAIAGPGFAASQYLSAQLAMETADGTQDSTRRFAARHGELMRRLEAEPTVRRVTFAKNIPGDERSGRIFLEGGGDSHGVKVNHVAVNFFQVFDVPVLGGRGFGAGEGATVVVNQPLAQQLFGGNALGRRIRYTDVVPARWYEIVGLVTDFPLGASPGMRDTNQLKIYHAAEIGQLQPAHLLIHMRDGNGSAFAQRLRDIAMAVDADLSVRELRGLDEALGSEQWISRITAAAFFAITLSVLILSSAGIYALMSFTVSQRRKEVGIRMALGADWTQIVRSVFSRALMQLGAGAVLGLALVIALNRASGDELMRRNAWVVLPLVTLVVVAVGFLAALGPTRRSLRIQPTEALREQ